MLNCLFQFYFFSFTYTPNRSKFITGETNARTRGEGIVGNCKAVTYFEGEKIWNKDFINKQNYSVFSFSSKPPLFQLRVKKLQLKCFHFMFDSLVFVWLDYCVTTMVEVFINRRRKWNTLLPTTCETNTVTSSTIFRARLHYTCRL